MKHSDGLWCLTILALVLAFATDTRAASPTAEMVAPGIWRIRYGTPEANTPLKFRSAEPSSAGLSLLPKVDAIPLPVEQTSFHVAARGCSIELPMAKSERIYGLGLNTKFFEMSGKRAFIVPGDQPENEMNTSHAPVPFYVSSLGFGVYVDTARFASFYTGSVDPAAALPPPMLPATAQHRPRESKTSIAPANCASGRCSSMSPRPKALTSTSSPARR